MTCYCSCHVIGEGFCNRCNNGGCVVVDGIKTEQNINKLIKKIDAQTQRIKEFEHHSINTNQVNPWISIEIAIPSASRNVIAYTDCEEQVIVYRLQFKNGKSKWINSYSFERINKDITHWKELSPPPN